MQVGYDKSQLFEEDDAALFDLQAKADKAIAKWDVLGREFMPCEMAWYNSLTDLSEYITKLLARRDGCND